MSHTLAALAVTLALVAYAHADIVLGGGMGKLRTLNGVLSNTASDGFASSLTVADTELGAPFALSDGTLLVPSPFNAVVYSMSSTGASLANFAGTKSVGNSATTLQAPISVVVDANDVTYIADIGNCNIRSVASGATTMGWLAGPTSGTTGNCEAKDGTGAAAGFCAPRSLVISTTGSSQTIYVADSCADAVRSVSLTGAVASVTAVTGILDLALSQDETSIFFVNGNSIFQLVIADGSVDSVAGLTTSTEQTYTAIGTKSSTYLRPRGIARGESTDDSFFVTHQCNEGTVIVNFNPNSPALTLVSGNLGSAGCASGTPVVNYLSTTQNSLSVSKSQKSAVIAKTAKLIGPDEIAPIGGANGWSYTEGSTQNKINWYLQQGRTVTYPAGVDTMGRTMGKYTTVKYYLSGTVAAAFVRKYTVPSLNTAVDYETWYKASFLALPAAFTPTALNGAQVAGTPVEATLDVEADFAAIATSGTSGSLAKTGVTFGISQDDALLYHSLQTNSGPDGSDFVLSKVEYAVTGIDAGVVTLDFTKNSDNVGLSTDGAAASAAFKSGLNTLSALQLSCATYSPPGATANTDCTNLEGSVAVAVLSAAKTITGDYSVGEMTMNEGSELTVGTSSNRRLATRANGVATLTMGTFTANSGSKLVVDCATGQVVVTQAANINPGAALELIIAEAPSEATTCTAITFQPGTTWNNGQFSSAQFRVAGAASTSPAPVRCSETGCVVDSTAPLTNPPTKDETNNTAIILGVIFAVVFVIGIVAFALVMRKRDQEASSRRPTRDYDYEAASSRPSDSEFTFETAPLTGDSRNSRRYGSPSTSTSSSSRPSTSSSSRPSYTTGTSSSSSSSSSGDDTGRGTSSMGTSSFR